LLWLSEIKLIDWQLALRCWVNVRDHRAGESGSGASPYWAALFIDFNMALCPTISAINIDNLNKIRNTEVE
jgi:hypothetical protein